MIQIRIIGIRKPGGAYNDHSAISHYQWRNEITGETFTWDRMTMVNWILQNPRENVAYVKNFKGNIAYCKVVRNQFGTMFLETYSNNTMSDNLLSLPQI